MKLKEVIWKKRPVFLKSGICCLMTMQDHTQRRQPKAILQLFFESAYITPYSPDLAPNDFHVSGFEEESRLKSLRKQC
ncbi:hypothetical protein TNCV_3976091 [Trichonephila clavipes]|nr:hypothetical protein TNCV_3976091 [Trichonephila clavipes]